MRVCACVCCGTHTEAAECTWSEGEESRAIRLMQHEPREQLLDSCSPRSGPGSFKVAECGAASFTRDASFIEVISYVKVKYVVAVRRNIAFYSESRLHQWCWGRGVNTWTLRHVFYRWYQIGS